MWLTAIYTNTFWFGQREKEAITDEEMRGLYMCRAGNRCTAHELMGECLYV